ncbi:unnamed protein product [Toxocara canis]|uniref:Uncharacterized protein n=1 Tax=Toxocara canis TaxID=6265 RepID=A0A183UEN7_TOXCA|nr:unnamed protein product [Toxocara canis]
MTLTKIEEGVDEGEVLYHSYIRKSAEELVELRTELLDRKKLKERRRKENERRVIQRLKAIADERAAWERSFEQERQKIIDRQRAVTGEEDDGRSERRDRLLNNQRKFVSSEQLEIYYEGWV